MNPATLLLAGAGVLAFSRRKPSKKTRPCPPLAHEGGTFAGFDYIEYVTGGADPSSKLPLIVYFHSLGSEPRGLAKHLKDLPFRARVVMPRGNESWGSGPAWWSMRSKTEDQHGLAVVMNYTSRQMTNFIREISRCRPTVGKPVIAGHSQGGMMTFAVAAASPRLVKAAVPASGWLPVELWPKRMPPTVALHGTKDSVVSYSRTKDFLERAIDGGLPIQFIPIEGAGHGLSGDLKSTWKSAIQQMSRGATA